MLIVCKADNAMKCQVLLPLKNKNEILECPLLQLLFSALRDNWVFQ